MLEETSVAGDLEVPSKILRLSGSIKANCFKAVPEEWRPEEGIDIEEREAEQTEPEDDPDPRSDSPASIHERQRLSLIEELKIQLGTGNHRPRCYDNNTFWQHQPDPYFAMQMKANPAQSSELLCKLDTFVWLPHLLGDEEASASLQCPRCRGSQKTVDRFMCRKVRDLHRDFFLLGCRYQCIGATCKRTFASWDSEAMKNAVPRLKASFPALLSHRSGLSRTIVNIMRPAFANSIGPAPFSSLIGECQRLEHHRRQLTYLDSHEANTKRGVVHAIEPLVTFPDFADKATYSGVVPSGNYLKCQYNNIMAAIIPLLNTRTSLLSTKTLQGDHSHKVSVFHRFFFMHILPRLFKQDMRRLACP